ncbi:amidase [Actibacterium sp. XHP0104]|uniref:amidase n=1 Tax=Actibacterium sp. XHP0104 TaxID=2984335 RepID=UPI0021E8C47C|nr:amidase family protein [Actibacterium sp. XHP0104]MCV2881955.1 amidase family protein [Actibacterium sp. XHP0104]
MAGDWLRMSAGDLGRAIGAGRIDPVALTEAYLEAIAAHPHAPRIYARTTMERALAEAGAAHARARDGARLGPLDGVPVSWKDLFDTAGVVTEAGSALLAGRVPTRDAAVLRNATAAGLVCLGKTHMSELAFSGLGLNPVTATPPCVNDESAVSGGSSSGAAASVAFGLAAAAVGSDTGGSVRIPSAWNDLVGLKTSSGRLSLTGSVPLAASFDTVGPLTRTVEDAALMLAALGGGRAADLRGASLRGTRFMILKTVGMENLRDAPRAGFTSAVERLQAAGAIVNTAEAPEVAQAMDLAAILFTAEAYGTWGQQIEAAPERMFPPILERFRAGAQYTAADFVAAWHRLRDLRAQWAARVAGYDAVLLPTSPILPPDAARLMSDGDYYVTENLLALRNTRVGNLMDCAALTLPTGVPSCGIMFLGAPGGEERLLRIGAAAEAALA